jgi:glucokinase
MVLDVDGPPCPCGASGCWERYASGSGLGRLAREAADAGLLRSVTAAVGGNPEAVRGEDVTAAASAGDPEALAVVYEVAWWLARGIANLVCVLDPTCIVVGGGMSDVAALLVPPAARQLAGLLEGSSARTTPELVSAALGAEAGAIGAALRAGESS